MRSDESPTPSIEAPTFDEPFPSGTAIGDVWVVQARLGRGGMGSVYRCHNKHASRIVAAIKLLDPAFQFHPEARVRFLREAEILSTVDHPNVVGVANVNLDESPPFLEMDFVRGEALEARLDSQGAFSIEEATHLIGQLADALRYLHMKRIYHRDIKPPNILITPKGDLKLVDFGLAVQVGGRAITAATAVDFGTVSYCPPEWGGDQPVDPVLWDLYALGVVLYEMLTGTLAFPTSPQTPGPHQILRVIAAKQRTNHLEIGPEFQPALRQIVQRLTAREPKRRYPDARSLLKALKAVDPTWTPSESARPRTEPPAERQHRPEEPPGSNWVPWLGVAGVYLLLIGFGLGFGVSMAVLLLALW